MTARRSYGTGSLYVREDSAGRETWYGRWHANGSRVKRRIGLKRTEGATDGLTRTQAEAKLRELMAEVQVSARAGERLTVAEVDRRYRAHGKRAGRKPSTLGNIESEVRVHLVPFFRDKSMDSIRPEDVLDLVTVLEGKRLAPKTIRNIVATLSALFNFAKAPRRQ